MHVHIRPHLPWPSPAPPGHGKLSFKDGGFYEGQFDNDEIQVGVGVGWGVGGVRERA